MRESFFAARVSLKLAAASDTLHLSVTVST